MKKRKTPITIVLRNKLSELKRRISSNSRRMPSFVVIGTARGGTTSLFNYLSLHPQIELPVKKEIAFFCTHFHKGVSWYQSHFPMKRDATMITGEASPYYLSHPKAAERLKSVLPDSKIIVLLRNPIERSFSSYKNIKKLGLETSGTFELAIELENDRTSGEEKKIVENDSYYSSKHQHFSYLGRSIYHLELEKWFKHFPPEQFLIINSESFYADPVKTYHSVIRFLGLSEHDPGPLKPFNESVKGEQINSEFRKKLEAFFEPHNEKLFEMINTRFDWK
jgi:hypothetical protein